MATLKTVKIHSICPLPIHDQFRPCRRVHARAQVPPKVKYGLTDWGQVLCPALDVLLKWADLLEEHRQRIV